MKTVLFLDANETVEDAIKYAKRCGYRVITSDNNPSHIGHQMADKAYFISTYDIDGLKSIVEKEHVDGIVYMASANGLYGASRLNELYHLPGISYSTEQLFSNKKLFREFLQKNGFDNPVFQSVKSIEEIDFSKIEYPVIVKPADAGGGNEGVSKVLNQKELFEAVNKALKVLSCTTVLIESFIESELQINGDCLIHNGELQFMYLGKHIYSDCNSIVPYAGIFSLEVISESVLQKIRDKIQRLIYLTHLKSGVLNIELRMGRDGKIYFVEINPRHSGNCIFRLMNKAYGVNMSEIAVRLALGESIDLPYTKQAGNYAYVLFYALKEGILKNIDISSKLQKNIIDYRLFIQKGDIVHPFRILRNRLALLHLSDTSSQRLYDIISNITDYYSVKLK